MTVNPSPRESLSHTKRRSLDFKYIFKIIFISVAYFIPAWLGLKVGAVSTFATLIWPPTGIALTALVIGGIRLWPAVTLGALLVNWFLGAPLIVALGMATGNTLEAIVGAALLNWIGFKRPLERLRDVFALVVFAGFFSTLISATVGAASLYLGGMVRAENFPLTWASWWVGDVMGDIIVAPFLLIWSSHLHFKKVPLSQAIELIAFGIAIILGSFFLLTDVLGSGGVLFPHAYLIFPFLMLVAVRLNQRWTITAIVTVAAITLWATATGHARFQADSLSLRLFQAQIFLAVVAISKMVLAATVMERRQRESENERLYLEAHEALLARDEFLSIASHELKTPLTSLSLRFQMLSRGIKQGILEREKQPESEKNENICVPFKVSALVLACEEQCKRLSGLLDELLDLTRIRLGKLQLTKENVDLCEVIKSVVDQFRAQTTEAGVAISVRCESPIIGFWDKTRIEQIVSNLISNALKYGEGTPVSVAVEKDETRGKVKLIVRDQGPGIPLEMQEKIFERFERAGMTGQKISGLGLGLYICRQIVEAHGGNIRVNSERGSGSTFIVELPTC